MHPREVISNKRSSLAEIPKQQHGRILTCVYLKLPGRMTALQINTLFSAWDEKGKFFLL